MLLMKSSKQIDKSKQVEELLTRGVQEIHIRENLSVALYSGKKLRVKHGIDPTGPKIHIGRAVVLWKLRQFQELGHKIVLIIGDFTAQIGDPSDKLSKRPFLTREQIKKNLKNYLPQIGKILDLSKVEVRYNSEWLAKLNFREISELADLFSVQQMIVRRNFKDRFEKQEEISLREFMYPLMQGYDSVAIKADVELGGEDQLFNLLAGRKIQERYEQKPQDILTTRMVLGLDRRKMSTSWGNVLNIIDPPNEQYGKVMSMHDNLIVEYLELCTRMPMEEVKEIDKQLKSKKFNPRDAKARLAFEVVKLYHGEKAAKKAGEEFDRVFRSKELPTDVPEFKLSSSMNVVDLLVVSKLVSSKSEARRLIEQGGVRIADKKISGFEEKISPSKEGSIIQVGKRKFLRVVLK